MTVVDSHGRNVAMAGSSGLLMSVIVELASLKFAHQSPKNN